jgi:cell wall-associated NlpC family hydrolase
MTTRAEIVAAARRWLDTPYAAHQRQHGVGIDCAGLPIVVARECGLKPADFDINGYSLHPDGQLLRHCREHMEPVKRADMGPGHVLVVSWGRGQAQHFGIVAEHSQYPGHLSIIHAEAITHRKVIETRLVFTAHTRFVAAFAFPGVA